MAGTGLGSKSFLPMDDVHRLIDVGKPSVPSLTILTACVVVLLHPSIQRRQSHPIMMSFINTRKCCASPWSKIAIVMVLENSVPSISLIRRTSYVNTVLEALRVCYSIVSELSTGRIPLQILLSTHLTRNSFRGYYQSPKLSLHGRYHAARLQWVA